MKDKRTKVEMLLDGVDRVMSNLFELLVEKSDKSDDSLCRLQDLEERFQDFTSEVRRMEVEAECRKRGHDWNQLNKTCRRCGISKPPEGCLLVVKDKVLSYG